MRILVACECSGRVRQALATRGHDVWSVDLDPSEDGSPRHLIGDAIDIAYYGPWDMMIAHPPCTYLANSGVRWLYGEQFHHITGHRMVVEDRDRWKAMREGAKFFAKLLLAPIPKIAIENPVMHCYAREEIEKLTGVTMNTHFVQPWWGGDPAFKATGFTLKGLPPLVKPPEALVPPKKGTPEHKAWSVIHNMAPSKTRAKDRSRTFPGIAKMIANQWG